ncbi:MAG: alanyl-tRNA editing protein AlaXM [Candidatus Woesearchaeota archaeon]
MTELLYMNDCYLKEFEAQVTSVEGSKVELDRTAFSPQGGGLVSDTGRILRGEEEFVVTEVKKEEGRVWHYVNKDGLKEGDAIKGAIDWDRRYNVMRYHTAIHILAAIMHDKAGALITGNQISQEGRLDLNLENFDREKIGEYVRDANEAIKKNAQVKTYFLPREEAMKIPAVVKLANALPPQVEQLRIVEIEGIDTQADGGVHVANTSEIGQLEIVKLENKGKSNRRIYFRIA